MRFFHYLLKKGRHTLPKSSVVFFIIASVLNGCSTKFVQPERQNFSFDYTPAEQSLARTDGNLSFALLDFQVEVEQYPRPQPILTSNSVLFDKLARGLERDFSEIITAQGYGIKGPFESYSEMTYPDKEATDLILFTKIFIQADHSNLHWVKYEDVNTYGISPSRASSASLDISFEFHIYESLSKEMLWTKSITLEPLTIYLAYASSGGIRYEIRYEEVPGFQVLLQYDNSYHAAVGNLLEREYSNIIDRMIAYLHPREMAQVNKAANRVRAKKVY